MFLIFISKLLFFWFWMAFFSFLTVILNFCHKAIVLNINYGLLFFSFASIFALGTLIDEYNFWGMRKLCDWREVFHFNPNYTSINLEATSSIWRIIDDLIFSDRWKNILIKAKKRVFGSIYIIIFYDAFRLIDGTLWF